MAKTKKLIALCSLLIALVLLALPVIGAVCTSQNDAIAGFTFDDGENLIDIATNRHNITNDGTESVDGKIDKGRGFVAGNTDLLQIGTPEFVSNYDNYSIVCWVNETSASGGTIYSEANSGSDDFFLRLIVVDSNYVYFQHQSSGTDIVVSGGQAVIGLMSHVVVTRAGSLFNIFVNGELDSTGTAAVGNLTNDRSAFGVLWRASPLLYFEGALDECYIYNRTITDTEINDSYNSGDGCQPYAPVITSDSSKISLLFANLTDPSSYKVLFDEGEDFISFVNFTNRSGTPFNSSVANCSISIQDGLVEVEGNNSNFSVCNTGCDFSTRTEQFSQDKTTNAVSDIVHFDACHVVNAQGDLTVNVSCGASSEFFSVTPAQIPMCSLGSAFIQLESEVCNSSNDFNVSINGNLILNRAKQISDLAVDRKFSVDVNDFSGETFFNSTLGLWTTNHSHEFYEHGSKKVWANCTHSNTTFSNSSTSNITIVNAPPVIFIEQVNTSLGFTGLFDKVTIEYAAGVWNWFGAVVDDDAQILNVTWRNASGSDLLSFQGNPATTLLNTPDLLFADFSTMPFSLNVTVNDSFGAESNASILFNVSDSSNPTCNFSGVYTIPVGNYSFDILCTDENFFSLNVTCPANNMSNSSSGLNVESFVFNESFFINVSDTCSFRYCDGHTANKLVGYWDAYVSESRIQITSNFEVVADVWTDSPGGVVSYSVLDDRVSYTFNMSSSLTDKFVFFVNASQNSYYFPSDEYLGWLVIDGKFWIDFNSDQLDESDKVKVRRLENGLWEVSIKAKDKVIRFDSIGELNCVSGSFEFRTPFVYALDVGVCPSSIAGVLTLWLVFLFALFLITAGWIWKLRETGFFGSLLLITVSWTVVACHLWAGYVCVGIGFYYLFWFILKK